MMFDPAALPPLQTPALILDLDAMEANIATLADFAASHGMRLRPHAKTHKSSAIALRQIAAGAVGISAATLGEAAGLASAGIPSILLTTPVAGPAKLDRLAGILAGGAGLICVAESLDHVAMLAKVAEATATVISVMADFDAGHGRSGATTAEAVARIAAAIASEPKLSFAGLQAYAGNVQHIVALAERQEAQTGVRDRVRQVVQALEAADLAPGTVTGGGSGSFPQDTADGVFTELQCGSYTVMDEEYLALERPEGESLFVPALYVLTTIVGHAGREWVTVDAGTKAMAAGFVPPRPLWPTAGGSYRAMGDEHGAVEGLAEADRILGSRMLIRPAHCDPTINLHPILHGIRAASPDKVVEIAVDLR